MSISRAKGLRKEIKVKILLRVINVWASISATYLEFCRTYTLYFLQQPAVRP